MLWTSHLNKVWLRVCRMEQNAFLRAHVWINKLKKYLLSLGRFVVNVLIYVVSTAALLLHCSPPVEGQRPSALAVAKGVAGARWSRAHRSRR